MAERLEHGARTSLFIVALKYGAMAQLYSSALIILYVRVFRCHLWLHHCFLRCRSSLIKNELRSSARLFADAKLIIWLQGTHFLCANEETIKNAPDAWCHSQNGNLAWKHFLSKVDNKINALRATSCNVKT